VSGLWAVYTVKCSALVPLLQDKVSLIFKLAPSVCRMTFPISASLLVRLVVLLPFQLLRLSLATPSRWTDRKSVVQGKNTDLGGRGTITERQVVRGRNETELDQ